MDRIPNNFSATPQSTNRHQAQQTPSSASLERGSVVAASSIKDAEKMPKLNTGPVIVHNSNKDSTYVCFDMVHRHTLKNALPESAFKSLSPTPSDIELLPISVDEAVDTLQSWGFKKDPKLNLEPKMNSVVMYVSDSDNDEPTHFIVSTNHDSWLSKNGLHELIEIKKPEQLEGRFGKPELSFTLGY